MVSYVTSKIVITQVKDNVVLQKTEKKLLK